MSHGALTSYTFLYAVYCTITPLLCNTTHGAPTPYTFHYTTYCTISPYAEYIMISVNIIGLVLE